MVMVPLSEGELALLEVLRQAGVHEVDMARLVAVEEVLKR
ncbi:hypothetical protein MTAT_20070 [Moorella thermoacetica]|uniref:Uncharacterized protein n=1 Tax=Neomoorella thermoacetica TaxID=1525 RepID=A0AAC9MVQ4_NEOTH|nr:hypothetical protein Maut_02234 [Moorella thermoacetica]TYL12765.1 hypothetical protein MTAT_20070 [Moorella thermoacetica]